MGFWDPLSQLRKFLQRPCPSSFPMSSTALIYEAEACLAGQAVKKLCVNDTNEDVLYRKTTWQDYGTQSLSASHLLPTQGNEKNDIEADQHYSHIKRFVTISSTYDHR